MKQETNKKDEKKWFESKTIWAIIITLSVTVAQQFGIDFPEWLIPALVSAGLYFDRIATKNIKQ